MPQPSYNGKSVFFVKRIHFKKQIFSMHFISDLRIKCLINLSAHKLDHLISTAVWCTIAIANPKPLQYHAQAYAWGINPRSKGKDRGTNNRYRCSL